MVEKSEKSSGVSEMSELVWASNTLRKHVAPPGSAAGKMERIRNAATASKHYDYANLSGRYEDIEDYAAMCRSCHWKYDGKVNNITKGGMPNAQA